jgi:FlaA1/EpsC-like NDP-sugar epimerase
LSCAVRSHTPVASLVLLGHGENSISDAQLDLRESYPDLKVISVIADILISVESARSSIDCARRLCFTPLRHVR